MAQKIVALVITFITFSPNLFPMNIEKPIHADKIRPKYSYHFCKGKKRSCICGCVPTDEVFEPSIKENLPSTQQILETLNKNTRLTTTPNFKPLTSPNFENLLQSVNHTKRESYCNTNASQIMPWIKPLPGPSSHRIEKRRNSSTRKTLTTQNSSSKLTRITSPTVGPLSTTPSFANLSSQSPIRILSSDQSFYLDQSPKLLINAILENNITQARHILQENYENPSPIDLLHEKQLLTIIKNPICCWGSPTAQTYQWTPLCLSLALLHKKMTGTLLGYGACIQDLDCPGFFEYTKKQMWPCNRHKITQLVKKLKKHNLIEA